MYTVDKLDKCMIIMFERLKEKTQQPRRIVIDFAYLFSLPFRFFFLFHSSFHRGVA